MALIVVAADKGAPGVTTTALALAGVWPRPVLLAECDPSGGDLVYRFPAAHGSSLDPRRGLLTLAVAARRGLQPGQLWEHTQKLSGGLDVLAGVINAEQGAGLGQLWGPLGELFAGLQGGDVIADCGRLGADGPQYDLLAQAAVVLLVTRSHAGDVIRLRDRTAVVAAGVNARGRRGFTPSVLVIADQRNLRTTVTEVGSALAQGNVPATMLGGLASDSKGAELLRGEWGGRLDKTLLMRSARETAQQLAAGLPEPQGRGTQPPSAQPPSAQSPLPQPPVAQASAPPPAGPGRGAHPPAAQPMVPPPPVTPVRGAPPVTVAQPVVPQPPAGPGRGPYAPGPPPLVPRPTVAQPLPPPATQGRIPPPPSAQPPAAQPQIAQRPAQQAPAGSPAALYNRPGRHAAGAAGNGAEAAGHRSEANGDGPEVGERGWITA
jgi:hypothetical protein